MADLLKAANNRLKAAGLKVRLKLQGPTIYMVATLPPRPGDTKRRAAYQQALSTGQKVTRLGVRHAETQARQLGDLVAAWRANRKDPRFFDWGHYPTGKTEAVLSAGQAVEIFKAHYLETRSIRKSTWVDGWQRAYNRLAPGAPLTAELLERAVMSTKRNTKTRLNTCRKLQHLANYHGLKVDLLQYKGDYGPSKVKRRELPTDAEIAHWREQIKNKRWQWVYGIMAAGGLRPHEAFFCEWNNAGDQLLITRGKTGDRVLSLDDFFFKEWVDQWGLREVKLPRLKDKEKAYREVKIGSKVGQQFRLNGVPFPPYTLRHCCAVRMALFNVPVPVAARILGHTAAVHMNAYQKHINAAQHAAATARAQTASDRPTAPVVDIE